MSERVWFVTGCSTGIGRALAEVLTDRGKRAVVTARRAEAIADLEARAPGHIRALALDIADAAAVEQRVAEAIGVFGRIDVLVNNAGVGFAGAIEEASDAEVRRVFDTNVFGTLNVIRTVLPQMRARRTGHIITVTSVGGFRGGTSVGVYNGSKFALEGIHEAMANELPPLGIRVTALEPGLVKTDFRRRTIGLAERVIPDYAATSGKIRQGLQTPYPPGAADPAQTAAAIIAFVDSGRSPPVRLPLGADAVAAMKAKMQAVADELATWEDFATSSGGSADALSMYSDAANAARAAKG